MYAVSYFSLLSTLRKQSQPSTGTVLITGTDLHPSLCNVVQMQFLTDPLFFHPCDSRLERGVGVLQVLSSLSLSIPLLKFTVSKNLNFPSSFTPFSTDILRFTYPRSLTLPFPTSSRLHFPNRNLVFLDFNL